MQTPAILLKTNGPWLRGQQKYGQVREDRGLQRKKGNMRENSRQLTEPNWKRPNHNNYAGIHVHIFALIGGKDGQMVRDRLLFGPHRFLIFIWTPRVPTHP